MSWLATRLGYGRYGFIGLDSAERLLNNNLTDSEEMREDIPANFINNYSYKGIALSGSSTSSSVWDVLRTSYDNNGNPSRYQIRLQIVWDNRTSGWS